MSEANRVIEVNATGINKINGKTLQEISSELAQANNNNAEESSFEVEQMYSIQKAALRVDQPMTINCI